MVTIVVKIMTVDKVIYLQFFLCCCAGPKGIVLTITVPIQIEKIKMKKNYFLELISQFKMA